MPDFYNLNNQYNLIAGVDEAGRGPLAGPVVAAAVILDPEQPIFGLTDSKRLSAHKREQLAGEIYEKSMAWAVCRAEVDEIDNLNILQASLLAMRRAVLALTVQPDVVLVDGMHCPVLDCLVKAIVRGDSIVPSISAASIIAKVTRDHEMVKLEDKYPGYGFAIHKGYPTKAHLLALEQLGASPVHRRSYAPVKRLL